MPKRIKVAAESETGRNESFHDNFTGQDMTRTELVRAIERGQYPNYHVRKIHGLKTPVSNPDPGTDNNLG